MITGFSDTGGSVRGAGPGRPSATRPVGGSTSPTDAAVLVGADSRRNCAGRRGDAASGRPRWAVTPPRPGQSGERTVGGALARSARSSGRHAGSNCRRGAPPAPAERRDSAVMADGEHLVWHQDLICPGEWCRGRNPSLPTGLPGRRRTPRATPLPVVRDLGDGAGVLRLRERPRRRRVAVAGGARRGGLRTSRQVWPGVSATKSAVASAHRRSPSWSVPRRKCLRPSSRSKKAATRSSVSIGATER